MRSPADKRLNFAIAGFIVGLILGTGAALAFSLLGEERAMALILGTLLGGSGVYLCLRADNSAIDEASRRILRDLGEIRKTQISKGRRGGP